MHACKHFTTADSFQANACLTLPLSPLNQEMDPNANTANQAEKPLINLVDGEDDDGKGKEPTGGASGSGAAAGAFATPEKQNPPARGRAARAAAAAHAAASGLDA